MSHRILVILLSLFLGFQLGCSDGGFSGGTTNPGSAGSPDGPGDDGSDGGDDGGDGPGGDDGDDPGNPDPDVAPFEALIRWLAPTEFVDGTPLVEGDLSAFKIFYSESNVLSSFNNGQMIMVTPDLREYLIDFLVPGQYYIVMTAVDTEGDESAYSNMIMITVEE